MSFFLFDVFARSRSAKSALHPVSLETLAGFRETPSTRARAMGSRDESDAFAPRVTFVRAARRWEQNARRASAGAASGGGEAVGASDAGAAAAVPERRPSVDGRKTVDELEAWMRRTNLRRAPEAHYLDVETLRHLFVADRAAHAGEPADAERIPPNVFGSLFGIACSKAFGAPRLARRRGLIGVTCDARAAMPPASPGMTRRDAEALGVNGHPVDDESRRESRRAASAEARAKKALLDPARSRNAERSRAELDSGRSYSRYVTELLKLACAPELVRLRLFPDAKELTESFAANNAARSFLWSKNAAGRARVDPADAAVTCVAVGDGNTPRTAALFAFLTRWHCVAVDPEMVEWREWRKRRGVDADDDDGDGDGDGDDDDDDDGDGDRPGVPTGAWGGVRRLRAFRKKIQEIRVECEKAVLVLVHAHVSLAECLAQVQTRSGRCSAVILPCCNWYQKLRHPEGAPPLAEYDDGSVASPQRTVRVFDDLPCGTLGGEGASHPAWASDAVCETVR